MNLDYRVCRQWWSPGDKDCPRARTEGTSWSSHPPQPLPVVRGIDPVLNVEKLPWKMVISTIIQNPMLQTLSPQPRCQYDVTECGRARGALVIECKPQDSMGGSSGLMQGVKSVASKALVIQKMEWHTGLFYPHLHLWQTSLITHVSVKLRILLIQVLLEDTMD